ncbi:MAG TPA: amidohydrolase family protein [Acidimicrobiales bacterium]|nr:amidohydrolase family protein [Acidimicrobiales bacterium]
MTITAAKPGEQSATPVVPPIISVDDHVVEPAHTWERWLPAKYREKGPHVERHRIGGLVYKGGLNYEYEIDPADGSGDLCDIWMYEGGLYPHKRHVAAVGFARDDMTLTPITYDEMRQGCWDPKHRLEDMTLDHVDKSLAFPTFPRFCGQTFYEAKDRETALECVYAYNNWMIEEWCGDSGGRLLPLQIIPLWDAELAAAEVRRNSARGCHAVCFSEIPTHLGLPSIHSGAWDPFFAACDETQTTVCMHIGSSSKMPAASPDAPAAVNATLSFNNSFASLTDFLFSGVFIKFANLKVAYSEGQIGWVPYLLERADDVWMQHRAWGGVKDKIPNPPSSYYYDHVYCCFFRDRHGLISLDVVGEDNITFETDYPHTDSSWPDTKEIAEAMFAGLTDEQIYKAVRGNAIRMLGLEPDKR